MIDMHSKYDNMHKNRMFYALIYINNHVIACYHLSTSVLGDELKIGLIISLLCVLIHAIHL